ncbi:MAG: glycolate oxidase subunit GlcE [Gammaproteobacteria bacterium]|nr:MAG: glycolate oxidase subunit GlcE [Gammaproteobacteria bacterium]
MYATVNSHTRNLSAFNTSVNSDFSHNLVEQVADAINNKTALRITGGNSKNFYGNHINGNDLCTTEHTGIIEYQPSELVVTVRSGTLLNELEAELKANKQMLAFEPPQHNKNTTIGGVIACGLSGPRRAACGSARDFVLGTTIINGKAKKCRFGGQVMKNVAGYDASRLMVGAQGTLGVLLDISLKVLPVSESEISLKINTESDNAIQHLQQWIQQGLPVSASCFLKDTLYVRLGSTHSAVKQSLNIINRDFDTEEIDKNFWLQIKNQSHNFFTRPYQLWRCSHQPTTEIYESAENQLLEWNGALRWIYSDKNLHTIAEKHGGHAQRHPIAIKEKAISDIFHPLQPGMLKIHKRLKQAFDPENILNPGRLYADL